MIRKYVDELVPGMIVAAPVMIRDQARRVLLEKGRDLSYEDIAKLREWGIADVLVEEDYAAMEKDMEDEFADSLKLLAVQARTCALTSIKDTAAHQAGHGRSDMGAIDKCVDLIIDILNLDKNQLVKHSLTQPQEDYIFTHSVNVSVLAMVIADYLDLSKPDKRALGEAALLHDIGLIYMEGVYWDHVDGFDAYGPELIRRHIDANRAVLEKIDGLEPRTAAAALRHHERLDGSGLPDGLEASGLDMLANIIAVADMYESLARPYDQTLALSGQEALKRIFGSMEKYDPRILKGFLGDLAMFPIGSVVRLSSGPVALVIGVRKDQPFRPRLRIITDDKGIKLTTPYEIDIGDREYSLTYIEKTLRSADIKFPFSWE